MNIEELLAIDEKQVFDRKSVQIKATDLSDASRRFVLLCRQLAIDWQEETLPPLEFKVRFAVAEGKGQ